MCMATDRVYADGKRLKVNEILAKLTAKQRKFAEGLVLGGLSKADAYREAYNYKGSSSKALRNNASKLAQHNGVAMAVRVIEEERIARLWENKDVFRNWIMQGITDTATNTESDITRLKALELAGRTRYASVFEEPQANEVNTALSGAMIATLSARLQSLLSLSSPTLGDGTPGGPILDTICDPVPPSDTSDTPTPTGGGEGE